jgi:CO/xanthine dehydrogenase Mo-binding subunit
MTVLDTRSSAMGAGERPEVHSIGQHAAPPSPIGVSVPRRDGRAKVTGTAQFTVDLDLPGMCHARLLRSPHAHARIRSIDVEAARRAPGVVAVVTAADLADVNLVYGHAVADHPLIATDVVRFAGEPVVAVVAEDALSAEQALDLVEVDYEPLPYVTDPLEALAPDAPLVHEHRYDRGEHRGFDEKLEGEHLNVSSRAEHGWGDVEAAFARAAHVVEGEYYYPMAYAYAMEPYTTVARFREGTLEVWASAQHPYMVRADLARCFNLPLANVRVSVPYVGGGYGSKSYTKIEPLTAALALRAERPVRLALSVEESMISIRSVSAILRLRTAFDADGLILARTGDLYLNGGAYAENSPRVANKASLRFMGPYRLPAYHVVSRAIYTNTVPGSSYRGLGGPQAVWAGESQMDEAAVQLGIDPIELRRRNLLHKGERPWPNSRPFDADLRADFEVLTERLGYPGETGKGRGRAVALSASDGGAEPIGTAIIRLHSDGSVTLMCGSAEMGQGSATVLPQIAAAELGVAFERVHLLQSDTAFISYDRSTGASRTTTVMGLCIQRAAEDVKRQLRRWAGEALGVDAEVLVEERAGLRHDGELLSWDAIVRLWFGGSSGEVVGTGYVRRAGATQELPLFWEVGCLGVEVSVDADTGETRVDRLVTIGDVGCAVNPIMAEGQDIGGAMMGLGIGLREELVYEGETLVNGNLFDYRVPRTTDLPAEVTSMLAERGDGVGPYGAKGGGEATVNPIAPAIANALYRATGVRLREAPLTPERVWRAMQELDVRTP